MQYTRKVLSITGLAIVAAVVLWYVRHPALPVAAAPAAASSRSAATPEPSPVVSPPPSGTATPSGAAPDQAAAAAAQPAPAVLAAADEHQSGKIARGLSEHGGSGLLVSATPPGSLTEQLRLEPGDIVVTVNGEAVASIDDFVRIYRAEGTPSELTILRHGREMHLH